MSFTQSFIQCNLLTGGIKWIMIQASPGILCKVWTLIQRFYRVRVCAEVTVVWPKSLTFNRPHGAICVPEGKKLCDLYELSKQLEGVSE